MLRILNARFMRKWDKVSRPAFRDQKLGVETSKLLEAQFPNFTHVMNTYFHFFKCPNFVYERQGSRKMKAMPEKFDGFK